VIISLIGMSGSGKSYWSDKLEELGYKHLNVDSLIEDKLGPELKALGYKGISDMAKWMGHPYARQYPRTSRAYLDLEQKVMRGILSTQDEQHDMVIDTTGSVIYMPDDVLEELGRRTTFVYFHTPESAHKKMARIFLEVPKPIVWGDSYRPRAGETPDETLARCYPELLRDRTKKYQKQAQVTLEFDQLRDSKMKPAAIIEAARQAVRA
jgi:shikimate kinase